jgi:hypothetical protein
MGHSLIRHSSGHSLGMDTSDIAGMKEMSGLVKELSGEMANLSHLLSTGKITDRELEKMQVRVMKTQRRLLQLESK